MLEYKGKFYLIKNGIIKKFHHKLKDSTIVRWREQGWSAPEPKQIEAWLGVKAGTDAEPEDKEAAAKAKAEADQKAKEAKEKAQQEAAAKAKAEADQKANNR